MAFHAWALWEYGKVKLGQHDDGVSAMYVTIKARVYTGATGVYT